MKHWSKRTFRLTEKADYGWQAGYCSVCHADMAIDTHGKVTHYNSHKNVKQVAVISNVSPR